MFEDIFFYIVIVIILCFIMLFSSNTIFQNADIIAGNVEAELTNDINSVHKANYTGDVKQTIVKEKVSMTLLVGGVILFFLVNVFYFFLDYEIQGKPTGSYFTKLFYIWVAVYLIVYLINFIITDTAVTAVLFLRIFFIVSLAYWVITGITFLTITMIPSLVEIFENTVGYSWINTFMGLKEKMSVIKSRVYPHFKIPSEILITKFNEVNLNDLFEGLMTKNLDKDNLPPRSNETILDFYLDIDEADLETQLEVKDSLFQLVRAKQKIGHMSWIFLSSFAAMIVSLIAMNENLMSS